LVLKEKAPELDWRSGHTPLNVSFDAREHLVNAKGKEIKRSKEETRSICLAYINEFVADEQSKQNIVDDF